VPRPDQVTGLEHEAQDLTAPGLSDPVRGRCHIIVPCVGQGVKWLEPLRVPPPASRVLETIQQCRPQRSGHHIVGVRSHGTTLADAQPQQRCAHHAPVPRTRPAKCRRTPGIARGRPSGTARSRPRRHGASPRVGRGPSFDRDGQGQFAVAISTAVEGRVCRAASASQRRASGNLQARDSGTLGGESSCHPAGVGWHPPFSSRVSILGCPLFRGKIAGWWPRTAMHGA
jgi:hypothetical protein